MEFICNDCPRRCGARRGDDEPAGFCASAALPRVARAAAHFGEEPCISGAGGSGTVFFTGCNLRCVFCQNYEISRGRGAGEAVSVQRLRDIFLRLRDEGVHNINLVTGTHFTRVIAQALSGLELGIPVVWNSSGYENVDTLARLEGLVQIYMPDFKYMDAALAKRYSLSPNYPEAAMGAILEMYRQVGDFSMDGDGMLQKGVLIRHLIMPGELQNSKAVMDWVAKRFPGNRVLFSLMSQYTPMPACAGTAKLERKLSAREGEIMRNYMADCGIVNGFWQEESAATGELIPDFDGTGVQRA